MGHTGPAVAEVLAGAGFDAGAGATNGPGALWTLSLLYAGAPVALKLAAVALVWGFDIDAAAQADLRARIEGR